MIQLFLRFYASFISPLTHFVGVSLFGPHFACRFTPTCSQYAKQAFSRYGIIQGLKLSSNRILRCHPFAQGGLDPLPDKI